MDLGATRCWTTGFGSPSFAPPAFCMLKRRPDQFLGMPAFRSPATKSGFALDVRFTPKADMCGAVADVRFGSKADMCGAIGHVRLTPESDIKCDIVECPLWAKSGHLQSTRQSQANRTLAPLILDIRTSGPTPPRPQNADASGTDLRA